MCTYYVLSIVPGSGDTAESKIVSTDVSLLHHSLPIYTSRLQLQNRDPEDFRVVWKRIGRRELVVQAAVGTGPHC